MPVRKPRSVFQLKVTLAGIKPLIWRRIQVWEDTKLPRVHRILQLIHNWEDYHLHEFVAGKRIYAEPSDEDELYERKVIDERLVPLSQVLPNIGDALEYHYDFGDNWTHLVLLEGILLPEDGSFYPRCVAGARNGPPEDVGGVSGYDRYVEAISDPDHAEHEDLLGWRGPFDAEAFSLDRVNAVLAGTFPSRRRQTVSKVSNVLRMKTRIPVGSTVRVELNDREREMLLHHILAGDDLTMRLREEPDEDRPTFRYDLGELGDLASYVSAVANHATDQSIRQEWERLYTKIAAILGTYTYG